MHAQFCLHLVALLSVPPFTALVAQVLLSVLPTGWLLPLAKSLATASKMDQVVVLMESDTRVHSDKEFPHERKSAGLTRRLLFTIETCVFRGLEYTQ